MKTKILITLYVVLFGLTLNAQTTDWFKAIEGRAPIGSVNNMTSKVLRNGNICHAGMWFGNLDFNLSPTDSLIIKSSTSGYSGFLVMYNSVGNLLWLDTFNNIGNSNATKFTKIIEDQDGNLLIAGKLNFIKLDPTGGPAGTLPAGNKGNSFVAKYNGTDGSLIWAKALQCSDSVTISSVTTDSSSNIYLTGYFKGNLQPNPISTTMVLPSAGLNNTFVIKWGVNGNYQWHKSIEGLKEINAMDIKVDKAGDIVVVGGFQFSANFNPPSTSHILSTNLGGLNYDGFIAKYAADGTFKTVKQLGGAFDQVFQKIEINAKGQYLVAGNFAGTTDLDFSTNQDTLTATKSIESFFVTYDTNFAWRWSNHIKGRNHIMSITQDKLGRIGICGQFEKKIILDKTNTNLVCTDTMNLYEFMCIYDSSRTARFSLQLGDSNYFNTFSRVYCIIGNDNQNNFYVFSKSGSVSYPTLTGMKLHKQAFGGFNFIYKLNYWPLAIDNVTLQKNTIAVYPNPTASSLSVSSPPENADKIYILNALGQQLRQMTFEKTICIDDLPPGHYLYHLVTKDQKEFTAKFVKE